MKLSTQANLDETDPSLIDSIGYLPFLPVPSQQAMLDLTKPIWT
jgi:hypothetical protein